MANGNNAGITMKGPGMPEQPEQQVPPNKVPSATRQGISTALYNFSAAMVGSAFAEAFDDPAVGQAFQQLGMDMTSVLNQRWWNKEVENFNKGAVADYTQNVNQIWNNYQEVDGRLNLGVLVDPVTGESREIDPSGPEAIQLRTKLYQDLLEQVGQADVGLMREAGKYQTNPIIGGMIDNLVQSRSESFQQLMGGYKQVFDQEQSQADVALTRGQIAETAAGIGVKEQQARKLGAESAILEEGGGEAEFQFPPRNVQPQQYDVWLKTTEKGRDVLDPYMQTAEALKTEELLETNPDLEGDPEAINRHLQASGAETTDAAVGMALKDLLNAKPGTLEALMGMKSMQRYFPETRDPTTPIDRMPSDTALNTEITKINTEALKGLIHALRDETFKNKNAAINDVIENYIKPQVNQRVGTFPNNDKVKDKLVAEARRYLDKNFRNIPGAERYAGRGTRGQAIFALTFEEAKDFAKTWLTTAGAVYPLIRGAKVLAKGGKWLAGYPMEFWLQVARDEGWPIDTGEISEQKRERTRSLKNVQIPRGVSGITLLPTKGKKAKK